MPSNLNGRSSHVAASYKDFLEDGPANIEQKSPDSTFAGSFKREKQNSD